MSGFKLSTGEVADVGDGASTPYLRLITEGKNPRGIPGAKFIDNVEDFLKTESIEAALGALNEVCEALFCLTRVAVVSESPYFSICRRRSH